MSNPQPLPPSNQPCRNEVNQTENKCKNEAAIEIISQKTSELDLLKRKVRDEAQELKCLRNDNRELAHQTAPVLKRYKEGKSQLHEFEACVNKRNMNLKELDAQMELIENKICVIENEQTEFRLEEERKALIQSERIKKMQREFEQLMEKIYAIGVSCQPEKLVWEEEEQTLLAIAQKETKQMREQADSVAETLQCMEARVHEIADQNSKTYEAIQTLEANCIPRTTVEISELQQTLIEESRVSQLEDQKRLEYLAKKDELSFSGFQTCSSKAELTRKLKEAFQRCQELKDRHQRCLAVEEKLASRIEGLKQESRRFLFSLADMQKHIERKQCSNE